MKPAIGDTLRHYDSRKANLIVTKVARKYIYATSQDSVQDNIKLLPHDVPGTWRYVGGYTVVLDKAAYVRHNLDKEYKRLLKAIVGESTWSFDSPTPEKLVLLKEALATAETFLNNQE